MGVQPIKPIQDTNEEGLKQLALQLACPEGKEGVSLGKKMDRSNASMIDTAVEALNIHQGDRVLEIGHGNAGHLNRMFRKEQDFVYKGLEVSKTMKEEAEQMNHIFMQNKDIEFNLYDGTHIPYEKETFNKIFTVNTIYFWQNPVKLFEEMYRVLEYDGLLSLVFATKEFMQTLAFTNFGFKLYEIDEWSGFFYNAGFVEEDIAYHTEQVISKNNEEVEREYVCIVLKKI